MSVPGRMSGIVCNILNFLMFSKVGKNIADKGDDHKDRVYGCDERYILIVQFRKHNQQDQTDKKDRGTDLSRKERALQHHTALKSKTAGDQLEAFFNDKQYNQVEQNRVAHGKTHNQCKLRCFISQRIQDLSNS